jgi:hypothetical protein
MFRRWLTLLVLLCSWSPLAAQEKTDDTIRLTVRPAAAPVPALKFQLLPDASELKPGNAVTGYYRAFAYEYQWHRQPEMQQTIEEWLKAKEEKKKPKVPEKLSYMKSYWALKEIDQAARREHCDWELTERVRQAGFQLMLSDIQPLRTWANLLTIRCHAELEDKDFTKAVYTCQTGMAMGRHAGEAPVLFNSLIGMAISMAMLENTQEIIATPGSPNLYWALTELPRPFVDLRRALQGERLWVQSLLGEISDLEEKPLSLERQADLQKRFLRVLHSIGDNRELRGLENGMITFFVLKSYPTARQWLLQQGKAAELVDRMPTFQVVLIYTLAEYRRLADEILKLQTLSHVEARPYLARYREQLTRSRQELDTIPLAALLMPAVIKTMEARVRLERRIDMLRVIEALRLYAAQHGDWPSSLEEIKAVPLPLDCYTGRPFVYRRDGNKVTLQGPSESNPPSRIDQVTFELTLAK